MILGAVGDVSNLMWCSIVLKHEYNVECRFEPVNVQTARWIACEDEKELTKFKNKAETNLAMDHGEELVYIAPTRVNLQMALEKWPEHRISCYA